MGGPCAIVIFFFLFLFQYSSKVSSRISTASASAVIAKTQDSVKNETASATIKLLPESTATCDAVAPRSSVKHGIISEDKQWHEVKTDYSKLIQHYLMLSKIRLTCRYHNLCRKVIPV